MKGSEKSGCRILVADDEEGVRTFLAESLERAGHEVISPEARVESDSDTGAHAQRRGRFERLGGSTPISVDVRWGAATNRDLRVMAREGTFREDLYHRLAVFPIRLPPLRERREDIVPLAESLLAHLSLLAGRAAAPRLDDGAKARLQSEPWPGNVRELRNVLERATILADGALIKAEHLWIEPSSTTSEAPANAVDEGSLAELERQAIERTLAGATSRTRSGGTDDSPRLGSASDNGRSTRS
jgi:DNA-binding NtrC family response regulator